MKKLVTTLLATAMVVATFAVGAVSASADQTATVKAPAKVTESAVTGGFEGTWDSAKLFDTSLYSKMEGHWSDSETPITVTFKTETAIRPTSIALGTADDGSYNNRAPEAFKLYGVKNGTDTLLLDVEHSGIQNISRISFEYAIPAGTETYQDYKLVVTDKLGGFANDYFQIAEVMLYTNAPANAAKVAITEISTSRVEATNKGDANKLIDGSAFSKFEPESPTADDPLTITFKTGKEITPAALMIYTANDDATWINRAPGAFKLYGVKNGTDTLILDVAESGIQNVNVTGYSFAITGSDTYDTFKLVITSKISLEAGEGQNDNGACQIGEIEIYESTAPVTPGTTDTPTTETPGTTDTPATETPDAPSTGDVGVVLSATALIAVAGAVVIAKKRKMED